MTSQVFQKSISKAQDKFEFPKQTKPDCATFLKEMQNLIVKKYTTNLIYHFEVKNN